MAFAKRGNTVWRLKRRELSLGEQTRVMGILNVTPDSFSDGGSYLAREKAVEHGLAMLRAGADLVDIGGESTRPGSRRLSPAEEQERILPVIEGILQFQPEALLSVDTFHATTAEAAIDAGAEIVNDVSGFLWDAEMATTCARLQCGVILMHTRGGPEEWHSLPPLAPDAVVPLVKRELEERLRQALSAGVRQESVVLDPGYGFGKRGAENYLLLAKQAELLELGYPLLAAASRKGFLGNSLASLYGGSAPEPQQRDAATLAAHTAAILAGASLIRVHEVRVAVEAARVADSILAACKP